jgi:Ankyrin repeats (3 copies)/Ankyrin repeat
MNENGRTPLQEAIYIGNYEEAKRLIWNEADVVKKTKADSTSLHLACQNETYDKQLVEMLLEKGCPRDLNALDAACHAGYVELVRILHKYGVILQERNRVGWNGFTYAVEQSHAPVVYFLLHHYLISEDMKTRLPFMRITHTSHEELQGPRYGFITKYPGQVQGTYPKWTREEWCCAVDTYFAVTENMLTYPSNLTMHAILEPYLVHFRETKRRLTAWFQVALRLKGTLINDLGRLIGLQLYNTRFECIPYEGQEFSL